MLTAQHSSASNEHYTPTEIIEAARRVMGRIDLDPASTQSVNQLRIKANSFFTKNDDGLNRRWHGNVWLNPPGGVHKATRQSNAAVWWAKLVDEYLAGSVKQAIFLGFSIEIMATGQDAARWPGEFPFCVPRKRIGFEQEVDGAFVKGTSPTHSNVIVYLPPVMEPGDQYKYEDPENRDCFRHCFEHLGRVSL